MKELIIEILKRHQQTFKWGSDGEYTTQFAVDEEDFNVVSDEIILALTSVKSEPIEWNDMNTLSLDQMAEMLRAKYNVKDIQEIARIILHNLDSVKSESAEGYKTQVVIPIQIRHKNYCDLNGKIIPTEFILDKEHFFYGGYGYIVMHDFANNSEAMKENAIGFAKYFDELFDDRDINFENLYNQYLTENNV